jgi:hypothetical protein
MAGWWMSRTAALTAILALTVIIRSAPGRTQEFNDLQAVQQKVEQLAQSGKYAEALALQQRLATEIEKVDTTASGHPGEKTANALVAVSWYALLAHDFQQALACTRTGQPSCRNQPRARVAAYGPHSRGASNLKLEEFCDAVYAWKDYKAEAAQPKTVHRARQRSGRTEQLLIGIEFFE